jgi:hypothetical protein
MAEQVSERIEQIADQLLEILEEWRGSRQTLNREGLCTRIGCNDRQLREGARQLRIRGYLIIADNKQGGYRFARNGQEVYKYTGRLKSRIQKLRVVAEAMDAVALKRYGPPTEQLSFL